MALAIGLPLAAGGVALAQTGPSGGPSGPTPSGPSAPSGPTTTCPATGGASGPSAPAGCATTTTTAAVVATTAAPRVGGSGLARTGSEAALPLAAAAGAITVVLGGRRLAGKIQG